MAPHTEVVTVPDSSSVLSTDGETPRYNGDDLLLSLYLVALFERLPKAVTGSRTFCEKAYTVSKGVVNTYSAKHAAAVCT